MKVPESVRAKMRGAETRSPIVLKLPMPPSVNALFYNAPGKGRGKTADYREWRKAAADTLWGQRKLYIAGPVCVSIRLEDVGRGDCDNRIKACLDLLVLHGFIDDDSRPTVRRVETEWDGNVTGCEVTITPFGSALHPVITRSAS